MASVFHESEDILKVGEEQAPWHCCWYEPDGRRRKKTFGAYERARKAALKFARKIEAELLTGNYDVKSSVTWQQFRKEYRERILPSLAARSRPLAETALNHFERLVKIHQVRYVDTSYIDHFVARRRKEQGGKRGDLVSPYTINKELRHLRAALQVALEWGYLQQLPRFRMERTLKKLPRFVTTDHFAAIYAACDVARMPHRTPYPVADWWRGILVMGLMTGWRLGDLLNLKRKDVDLVEGWASLGPQQRATRPSETTR